MEESGIKEGRRSRFEKLMSKKLFVVFKKICEYLDLGSLVQFEACCNLFIAENVIWKNALDSEKQKRMVEVRNSSEIFDIF